MLKLKNALTLGLLLLIAASCTVPLKNLTYMRGIQPDSTYREGPMPDVYRIRPKDQLLIQVIGEDNLSTAFLNLFTPGQSYISSSYADLITYVVDEKGFIHYPYVGSVKVSEMTVNEIRDTLQVQIDRYLKDASVFVKLFNRTITVLGEVRQPGVQNMVAEQLNIFEAIGSAGDITDYGNRRNVKLIRLTPRGNHVTAIDLTDPNLISSTNYYLLPHDVLYVEPLSKVYGRKTMPYGTGFSLAFSLISTAILIFSLFK